MAAAVALPESPRAFGMRSPGRSAAPASQLDEVLACTHVKVAQWRKGAVQAAQLEAQCGLRELRREGALLGDLQSDLASTKELVEAARRLKDEGRRLGEAMRHSADAGAHRCEVAARTRDQIREALEAQEQELQEVEALLEERKAAVGVQGSEIDRLLGLYRDRLGFSITRVAPQTVRMAFTLLDERSPSREFSFTLGLADSKGYRLLDCAPAVPEAEALLERLNCDAAKPTALPGSSAACGAPLGAPSLRAASSEPRDRPGGHPSCFFSMTQFGAGSTGALVAE
eukprot:CAMPEP_0197880646 /NCGR_PEP_ID=MMETSP1439-20131203/8383_1 /TAXON_ID=66791 /ORGANISM="Gonyaulax spinifera, Strain CCMP409" /LENGTH=284 /DNA_ID=CAMNT_0043500209 /DNA_START=26 /DNA_END=878 /DNA_ORIENTATION=-